MAYGSGPDGDPGDWQQKPPRTTDVEPKEPASPYPENPPSTSSPPAAVPKTEVVDAAYVANIAKEHLPDEEAFHDFISWARDGLPSLTKEVLKGLGINIQQFQKEMQDWQSGMMEREKALNLKTVPESGGTEEEAEWPKMPGVRVDEQCASVFDANDLALRGRKSVLAKHFYMPIIFPAFSLAPRQKWAFGQKIELRQEWRHEGFTLGELISSLSLLPNEELTIEVSSWQKSKTEITQETDSETRQRLEREQRRTDEESCVNEAAASNGWSVSASGSFSLGPASSSVGANVSGSSSERTELAAKQITENISKASNEVSLKRAVKITQIAESGSESRTTRRIRNPNTCHTVTYNFFQIVKLYDVQLRLLNDAPTLMLPGIFPAFYQDGKTPVVIPYWTIEGFTSPAVFLTQFFEVDRDLSQELHGFGLRVRIDVAQNPASAVLLLVQALLVGVKYLLRLDPAAYLPQIRQFVASYIANTRAIRAQWLERYGPNKGASEQITTPGIYADSLLGRCSACEDYVESSRYLDVMRQKEEVRQLEAANRKAEAELPIQPSASAAA